MLIAEAKSIFRFWGLTGSVEQAEVIEVDTAVMFLLLFTQL